MSTKRLPPGAAELLCSIRRGVGVFYMGGLDAYYFRDDTYRRCNAQARRLIADGLARVSPDTGRLEPPAKEAKR